MVYYLLINSYNSNCRSHCLQVFDEEIYKVYRGEVVPAVFDGWLDDLDVPSRMSAPAPPWELYSFKGDAVVEQTLGRRS